LAHLIIDRAAVASGTDLQLGEGCRCAPCSNSRRTVQQRPPATVSLLLLSMLPPPLLLLLLVLLLVSPGAHAVTPVVLHAWSFPRDVISTAFAVLENGGDALPAVVRGTQQAELNPEVHNVGPGGTPDSAGETTLDAMLMDGDTLNMGAVGALRGVSSAIYVASLVLRHTAHTLLAGSQATDFARTFGGQEVKDISTDYSSAAHSRWLSERSCQPNFWEDVAGDTGGCGTVADRPLASSCGVTPMSPAEPGAGTAAPYGRMAETPGSLGSARATPHSHPAALLQEVAAVSRRTTTSTTSAAKETTTRFRCWRWVPPDQSPPPPPPTD
jgi:hypothetical protein